MKEKILQQVLLFSSLPPIEIQHLAETLRTVEFPPKTIVMREGERGDRFYIVLSGEIEIIKAMDTPDERLLGARGEGEYIGEMSLLNPNGLRTASVRTSAATRLLEMTRDDFDALLLRHPLFAYEMVRIQSQRLTEAHNATIRDLHEKNRQITQAFEELKAAHLQIVEKEKLEHELTVAREIQKSILPRTLPRLSGFDFGARMEATRAVGGDFYDLVALGDQRVGIAVADVSDKGVPAAIFMALTRSLLRSEASREASPAQVLQNVNRQLLTMNESNMFVTVLYGVLDQATREFHYARAGHDPPINLDPHGKFVEPVVQLGQFLGIFPSPPIDEERLTLVPGSTLIVYTDGVTDQINERDEFFGIDRLCQSIQQHHALSAQSMCDRLFETLTDYRGGTAQSDDVTFVVVQAL